MKSSAVALLTLLAAVAQADIKLPDPKNPSSANFGIWKVEDTSDACVGASCGHGVTDSITINGASISNPCGTGEGFAAEDGKGQGAINAEGTLNFKRGICGSKPMTCQQSGSQWTCKYNAGGAVSARCVGVDNSKGVTMKDCHGSNPFKDIDNFILDLLCNSDGSFHC